MENVGGVAFVGGRAELEDGGVVVSTKPKRQLEKRRVVVGLVIHFLLDFFHIERDDEIFRLTCDMLHAIMLLRIVRYCDG